MSNPNPKNQFKKGQPSPNPKGRPKRDWTWASLLEDAMEEEGEDKVKVKTHITKALIAKAKTGDVVAQKEIMNRMDGMPQQAVDHTTKGEKLPTPIYGSKSTEEV